jgi:peptidoglycan/LPS O-acetylase OafA/YrhL
MSSDHAAGDGAPGRNAPTDVLDEVVESGASVEASDTAEHVDQGQLFSYRPALDGIRAIAVLAVLLYHGAQLTNHPITVLPGGFLGVDLFFVLSGFLITTLLVTEWRKRDNIRLGAFWGRRARRLLPALVMVVAAVGVGFLFAARLNLTGSQISRFPKEALSSLFYVANWNLIASGKSYFEQFGGASPLVHTWSLAIEEQFYLIWPVVLLVALRVLKLPTRVLAALALLGAVASAVLMASLFHPGSDPSRIYYGTDTRIQAMLVGASVALLLTGSSTAWLRNRLPQVIGVLGLAGCIAMFALVSDDAQKAGWMYTGGFFLMAVLAIMAVTVASGPQDTRFTRTLSWPLLVWIGTLSYGIYLWHWPIFVLLDSSRTGLGGLPLLALRLGVTFGVAALSYYYVEAPIRFGEWRYGVRAPLIMLAGVACVLLIATSVMVVKPSATDQALLNAGSQGNGTAQTLPTSDAGPTNGTLQRKLLLIGDSQMLTLAILHPTDLPIRGLNAAMIGCSISDIDSTKPDGTYDGVGGNCGHQLDLWRTDVARYHPDAAVMLFGLWEIFDRKQNGHLIGDGTPEFDQMKVAEMNAAFNVLTAKGATMVALTSPCFAELVPGEYPQPRLADTWRIDRYNADVKAFAAQHPGKVVVADLHQLLCPAGKFTGKVNGVKYTDDGVHVNAVGARLVWNWLENQLKRVPRSRP